MSVRVRFLFYFLCCLTRYQQVLNEIHQCYLDQRELLLGPSISSTVTELTSQNNRDHCALVGREWLPVDFHIFSFLLFFSSLSKSHLLNSSIYTQNHENYVCFWIIWSTYWYFQVSCERFFWKNFATNLTQGYLQKHKMWLLKFYQKWKGSEVAQSAFWISHSFSLITTAAI